uniref:non-specific serine/threonine protein kinase n=1 Tax=Chromera velia CCMP2878 TaxID=1169474 RepID=A0A0G4HG77_9ALVE|eukprot:Cvel_27125.t1-p1 / transcript=Cvel_27125.t1 / gene=Cvel_27125 / organism=Chromera_velia_CCMP2878 / gene_product=Serine/threonine-protein kinase Nek5, putative / transcript_product=Serine/threonine-protein kinase Nek5, putative / location=Cvel_scaffold3330:2342-7306(-) / protein_length=1455 / sequence_SO=supercontig / SO=protein_coding / is_pseudo=false
MSNKESEPPRRDPGREDSMQKYEKIKVIGEGAYGKCTLMRKGEEQLCVMKQIDLSALSKSERYESLTEVQCLLGLQHPMIIQCLDCFVHHNKLMIVMEYADDGDLSMKLNETKKTGVKVEEDQIILWFCQVVEALRHVHSTSTLHRDIKTGNVFLNTNGAVKLGDFGIAKVLDHENMLAKTNIGTPYYMSPELLHGRPYDQKSDIWSLGCVLYEMCTLRPPFSAMTDLGLARKITEGKFEPVPEGRYSAQLSELITHMLSMKPEDRPSAAEILSRPWLRERLAKLVADRPDIPNLHYPLRSTWEMEQKVRPPILSRKSTMKPNDLSEVDLSDDDSPAAAGAKPQTVEEVVADVQKIFSMTMLENEIAETYAKQKLPSSKPLQRGRSGVIDGPKSEASSPAEREEGGDASSSVGGGTKTPFDVNIITAGGRRVSCDGGNRPGGQEKSPYGNAGGGSSPGGWNMSEEGSDFSDFSIATVIFDEKTQAKRRSIMHEGSAEGGRRRSNFGSDATGEARRSILGSEATLGTEKRRSILLAEGGVAAPSAGTRKSSIIGQSEITDRPGHRRGSAFNIQTLTELAQKDGASKETLPVDDEDEDEDEESPTLPLPANLTVPSPSPSPHQKPSRKTAKRVSVGETRSPGADALPGCFPFSSQSIEEATETPGSSQAPTQSSSSSKDPPKGGQSAAPSSAAAASGGEKDQGKRAPSGPTPSLQAKAPTPSKVVKPPDPPTSAAPKQTASQAAPPSQRTPVPPPTAAPTKTSPPRAPLNPPASVAKLSPVRAPLPPPTSLPGRSSPLPPAESSSASPLPPRLTSDPQAASASSSSSPPTKPRQPLPKPQQVKPEQMPASIPVSRFSGQTLAHLTRPSTVPSSSSSPIVLPPSTTPKTPSTGSHRTNASSDQTVRSLYLRGDETTRLGGSTTKSNVSASNPLVDTPTHWQGFGLTRRSTSRQDSAASISAPTVHHFPAGLPREFSGSGGGGGRRAKTSFGDKEESRSAAASPETSPRASHNAPAKTGFPSAADSRNRRQSQAAPPSSSSSSSLRGATQWRPLSMSTDHDEVSPLYFSMSGRRQPGFSVPPEDEEGRGDRLLQADTIRDFRPGDFLRPTSSPSHPSLPTSASTSALPRPTSVESVAAGKLPHGTRLPPRSPPLPQSAREEGRSVSASVASVESQRSAKRSNTDTTRDIRLDGMPMKDLSSASTPDPVVVPVATGIPPRARSATVGTTAAPGKSALKSQQSSSTSQLPAAVTESKSLPASRSSSPAPNPNAARISNHRRSVGIVTPETERRALAKGKAPINLGDGADVERQAHSAAGSRTSSVGSLPGNGSAAAKAKSRPPSASRIFSRGGGSAQRGSSGSNSRSLNLDGIPDDLPDGDCPSSAETSPVGPAETPQGKGKGQAEAAITSKAGGFLLTNLVASAPASSPEQASRVGKSVKRMVGMSQTLRKGENPFGQRS